MKNLSPLSILIILGGTLAQANTFPDMPLEEAIRIEPALAQVPNQRIIQFRKNSTLAPNQQKDLIRSMGGTPIRKLQGLNAVVAYFPKGHPLELEQNPNVLRVENDGYMRLSLIGPSILLGLPQGCAAPDYTLINTYCLEDDSEAQTNEETTWGHDRIRGERAWEWSEGNGVDVCVIDSGVDIEHPELASIIAGGKNFSTSVEEPNNDIDDLLGHGTHVSGIIAAASNGVGVAGVAPEINLYMARVFGLSAWTETSMVIAGIEYCAELGAQVISMSLGGPTPDPLLKEAVDNAYETGAVVIAAAGNDYGGSVSYPAAFDNVIAVSASDIDDQFAFFSNVGPEIDLIAPGVDIYSTVPIEQGGYDTYDGTSMATPFVAGVAALVLAAQPDLSNDEAEAVLKSSARSLGLTSEEQGSGLVQACGAMQKTNAWRSSLKNDSIDSGETQTTDSAANTEAQGNDRSYSATTQPKQIKNDLGSKFGN